MNLPIERIVSALCAKPADFNIVHFKSITHSKDAPAHFWVSISADNGQYLLLSIVTTQMIKLEREYLKFDNEEALNCLIPLSNSDFKEIKKNCVINCNETMFLSAQELAELIDITYCGAKSKLNFDFVHYDEDFNCELKNRIILAILNSPDVKPDVKKCAGKIQGLIINATGIEDVNHII